MCVCACLRVCFLLQLLVCVSMSLWKFVVQQENVLGQILTFTLLYGALYSTYVWTGNTHTHKSFVARDLFQCIQK